MKPLFHKVLPDLIERFSPELMLAIEAEVANGHTSLHDLILYNKIHGLHMPAATTIGALEGIFLPSSKGCGTSPRTNAPYLYGSLCAYAMAQAGNIDAIDMLSMISEVPILSHFGKNPMDLKWNRRGIIHVAERASMAACRYAKQPDKGRELMEGMHQSYRDLLALSKDAKPDFSIASDQSDFAISHLVHEHLCGQIRKEVARTRPLNAQDILPYAGPLLVAMTITQPQIWIEEGKDPDQVMDVIRHRTMGFWSMTKMSQAIKEELVEVAIDAALLPFPSLRRQSLQTYWGLSMQSARAIGSSRTLDVAKYQPLLIGGAMGMFKPMKAESAMESADALHFIASPDYASALLGHSWQKTVPHDWANRTGAWVLGRYRGGWPYQECSQVKKSMLEWFMEPYGRHLDHPLVPTYLPWHEFVSPQMWAPMLDHALAQTPDENKLHSFINAYSRHDPERFDDHAHQLLSDRRRLKAHRALMPFITSNMRSFKLASPARRDQEFSTDLGL